MDQTISGLEAYIKVWGYLKYFHPNVVRGAVDWDSAFLAGYPIAAISSCAEEISETADHLLNRAHGVASFGENHAIDESQLTRLVDRSWMNDDGWFSKPTQEALQGCYSNAIPRHGTYVSPENIAQNANVSSDIGYPCEPYPNEQERMLALARYWNCIEYFAPYKDVIGEPWDAVLSRLIPRIRAARSAGEYQLEILECCCCTNDGHSYTRSAYLDTLLGPYLMPFDFSTIEGKNVVIHSYSQFELQAGDELLSIGVQSLDVLSDKYRRIVPGSNDSSRGRNIRTSAGRMANRQPVEIAFKRDGITGCVTIHPTTREEFLLNPLHSDSGDHWKILPGNIGLVNMGLLEKEEITEVMEALAQTRALIFDIRNYPKGTLWQLEHYFPGNANWVQFRQPNYACPGTFERIDYSASKKRQGHYQGMVAILVNERTQSQAEYTAMMFQSIPGCITVGSQTAGADGNVSTITLPGGIKTMFSGLGVFYPDGSPTQRVGIKVDVEVYPTIAGIRAGRDEVLEKAIEICNAG